jgi:hypothetical protein
MSLLAVVQCFHVLLLVYYSRIHCFLVFYSNSTTYKSMKTLNYGPKVHSMHLPLVVGVGQLYFSQYVLVAFFTRLTIVEVI